MQKDMPELEDSDDEEPEIKTEVREPQLDMQQIWEAARKRIIFDEEPPESMNLVYEDEEELNLAEDEVVVEATVDSGCVDHTIDPEDVPGSVMLVKNPPGTKDFVGAGGHGIKRHGKAKVIMEPEDAKDGAAFLNVMQVANVSRPLHSVGRIADTDKDVLFTKGECVVVPGGSLAKYVKGLRVFARYRRNRGLYTARFKVKDPSKVTKSGFARPGTAQ